VLNRRRDARLAHELLYELVAVAVIASEQQLDRDGALERLVASAPHARHAAFADQRLQLIAARYDSHHTAWRLHSGSSIAGKFRQRLC
jgi:hypothetical protein